MKDMKRLIDQSESKLEWALLNEGRRPLHDDARRMKVLAALGVSAALSTGAKSSWALAAGWKKALVGGFAVCAGVGGGVAAFNAYDSYDLNRTRQAADVVAAANVGSPVNAGAAANAEPAAGNPSEPALLAPADGLDKANADPATPLVPAPGADDGSSARRATRHSVTAPAASLRDEVSLLDRARSALRSGRPTEAAAVLETYRQTFPRGALRLEAEVVRVEVLAANGNRTEASNRAKKLLARSPNSVMASRLRGYVLE